MLLNVGVFLALALGLVALGVTQLFLNDSSGYRLSAAFGNAGGLLPRNDVTLSGVTVGTVRSVTLTDHATRVRMTIDPGVKVPGDSKLTIMRRSPIGDFVVNIAPGTGSPLEPGDAIPLSQTRPAVDPQKTISVLANVLQAVPSEDLKVVTSELAKALRGRGNDLRTLNEGSAALAGRILQVNRQLRDLITTGPKVTGVLAARSDQLAEDITWTKMLAQILDEKRYDLVDLYRNGNRFLQVADGLLHADKANLSCAIADLGHMNQVIGRAQNLKNLVTTLEYNHYFFDAADHVVQRGLDGRDWFRVSLLPHQVPAGRSYEPHLAPPDVYGANACRSPFGKGVGPARQPLPPMLAPGSHLHKGH
jgi:phospholipid/cholesterol/gamma-HCH transport system substrate-binding protein